ncbi:MAG: inositol monophosphatase [Balneola sp.]|nr:inositol monophosphatase [Balneola sp.]MBO6650371.1 inositol monophosphatase [Balneola sp.]MBO6710232.1 inositol monophosphatase [Balneola sp.]MBO6798917.1 inositol monophosphatase [Balneola sp.]MBO6870031.1 inositol monophosphatase [Balneola sp.]
MSKKYQKELETAKEAAKKASEIIHYYSSSRSFNVELKGKNDLVTEADVASEKEIIRVIKKEFPEDDFLAEESNTKTKLPDGRVWIIDPIDGTTNFAHGFPIYCISIALWVDGVPKMGLVNEVANGELFWATEGEGAYLDGKELKVSDQIDPSKSLIGTGFPYTAFEHVDDYLNLLKSLMKNTHGLRRPGAASYDLCCVAAGRFDGFFEYGLSPWDVAAGALIIQEAGGSVTDWNSGEDWLFGKSIISGNAEIVQFLQTQITQYFK